jgi:hypothetical protein
MVTCCQSGRCKGNEGRWSVVVVSYLSVCSCGDLVQKLSLVGYLNINSQPP